MNYKTSINNDELDVSNFIKRIWENKLKIVIVAFVTFAILFFFNKYFEKKEVKLYRNVLTIKPNKETEFSDFLFLSNKFLAKGNFRIEEFFLERFIEELMDYDEFVSILSNNKEIKQKISKSQNQFQELYDYTSRLKLEKDKNSNEYRLILIWNDKQEGKEILYQTLKLVNSNLKASLFKEVDGKNVEKKKFVINRDLERIDYLLEQKAIAEELNIEDNQVDNISLTQSNISFNVNTNDVAYYLRGYKAINKEIDLIENRKYNYIKNIQKEIEVLKKKDFNWVEYNIYLLKSQLLNKPPLSINLMLTTSLIITLLYSVISSIIQNNKSIKEN